MTCEVYEPEPRKPSQLRDEIGLYLHARLVRARANLPKSHPRYEADEPTTSAPIFICSTEDDDGSV